MSHKSITKESYEKTAGQFAHNVADLPPLESIDQFVKLLPPHAKLIDIGCGSGRDAKIFTERGVQVVGIDFCASMIEIAKATSPQSKFHVMDIEELDFPDTSFDGAWACCSLIHIPKAHFPVVLKKIHALLKDKGHFYVTLKKGNGETLEKDPRYEGDVQKFWAYYQEEELKQLLQEAGFALLSFDCVLPHHSYQSHPALRAFCQKR